MIENKMVTIYTQVYNTKPYLEECINSVLNQTYTNFEYIVVDNGCTDGSSELLKRFAEKDKRIKLICHEQNKRDFWLPLIQERAQGAFFTMLDSDDWWEQNYLETLMKLMDERNLDIICTGTCMYDLASGGKGYRRVSQSIYLLHEEFGDKLRFYHSFFRTVWGKIVRIELIKNIPISMNKKVVYGGDTLYAFQMLRQASKIGVDSSVLHNYRIHKASVSYEYNPRRFDADIYLNQDVRAFLDAYPDASFANWDFLDSVFANAIRDTIRVIENSNLTADEKLVEYHKIVMHPEIERIFKSENQVAQQCRKEILRLVLLESKRNSLADIWSELVCLLLMDEENVVCEDNGRLFAYNNTLFEVLFVTDKKTQLLHFLMFAAKEKNKFQTELWLVLQKFLKDNELLSRYANLEFVQAYPMVSFRIWCNTYEDAFAKMTEHILKGLEVAEENFLEIYMCLAALCEQTEAFLIAKVCLAKIYWKQKRLEKCKQILNELDEMGISDEEIELIKEKIC